MTAMEQQLLDALQRLEQHYSERDATILRCLQTLTARVDALSAQVEQYGPNPTLTLVANCQKWPRLSDLSWLAPTQECGVYEFATSVSVGFTPL